MTKRLCTSLSILCLAFIALMTPLSHANERSSEEVRLQAGDVLKIF